MVGEISTELKGRVQSIVQSAAAADVLDAAGYIKAGGVLRTIKTMRAQVAAVFDPLAKKAHATWKATTETRGQYDDPLAEAEKAIKGNMVAWADEQTPGAVPVLGGISLREEWQYEIMDDTLLPREYLVPDHAQIKALVKSLGSQCDIEGVRVFRRSVVAAEGEKK